MSVVLGENISFHVNVLTVVTGLHDQPAAFEISIHPFVPASQMLGQTTKSIVVVIRIDNLFIQYYNAILPIPCSKVPFKCFSQ